MTALYKVKSSKILHFSDPLHWSNFYKDKQRVHRSAMLKRQDLILYLANLHSKAISSGMPLGLIHIPMRLMSLRDWVQDYRIVLDHFFNVKQLGYNLGDGNHEISILTPKRISNYVEKAAVKLEYSVPDRPENGSISKVYIQQKNADVIRKNLAETSRLDLIAPVEWLLQHSEINFHFERSGKLQQRDTSIWPVAAVETWPSWLRESLFGAGIDIDSAYTQFITSNLSAAYSDNKNLLNLLYPDLLRSVSEKKAWREELCVEVLGLQPSIENIDVIKKVCMSLANGSKISPAILTGQSAFSITADIVINSSTDITPSNLNKIGKRLQSISKQYGDARKVLCSSMLKIKASRLNQKKIFSSYFEWERISRYSIWEACDYHGIMVHDGIDGIPEEYLLKLPQITEDLNIKLTRTYKIQH